MDYLVPQEELGSMVMKSLLLRELITEFRYLLNHRFVNQKRRLYMKIYVYSNDKEVLSFEASAVNAESFGEALKQGAMQLYSKWLAGSPDQDHKLVINEG